MEQHDENQLRLFARHGSVFRHERKLGQTTSSGTASTNNVKAVPEQAEHLGRFVGAALYSAGSDYDVFLDRVVSAWHRAAWVFWRVPRGYRSVTLVGVRATNVRGYGTTARVTGLDLSPVPASLAAAQADTF